MRRKKQWSEHFTDLYQCRYPEVDISLTRSITFIVTEQCNLRCKYCFQDKASARMTKEVAKEAIDFILSDERLGGYISSEKHPGVIIDFIGGEPLLEIELIEFIASYFKLRAFQLGHPWANKYMFSISTNGLLYTDPRVQAFLDQNAGRVSVGITIDGNKELHDSCRVDAAGKGSYDRVAKSVKAWIARDKVVHTKLTISHDNLPYLAEAIPSLYELGITNVYANCVFEDVWQDGDDTLFEEQLRKLADHIIERGYYKGHTCSIFSNTIGGPLPPENNQNWCGGTGKMIAIGPSGDIYPCVRYAPMSIHNREPYVVGSIYEGMTKDSPKLIALKEITRRSQSTDECWNCEDAKGCAWCSAHNYDTFGTPDKRATFICKMHKARVRANKYYWEKLKATGESVDE